MVWRDRQRQWIYRYIEVALESWIFHIHPVMNPLTFCAMAWPCDGSAEAGLNLQVRIRTGNLATTMLYKLCGFTKLFQEFEHYLICSEGSHARGWKNFSGRGGTLTVLLAPICDDSCSKFSVLTSCNYVKKPKGKRKKIATFVIISDKRILFTSWYQKKERAPLIRISEK